MIVLPPAVDADDVVVELKQQEDMAGILVTFVIRSGSRRRAIGSAAIPADTGQGGADILVNDALSVALTKYRAAEKRRKRLLQG